MKKFLLLISMLLFLCESMNAQEHGHSYERNEVGVSGGALYGFGHNEWGSAIHLHYFRTLGLHSKWSLGGGIEQAWVDGKHFNIGAGVKYQLLPRLSIASLPGITFISHSEADTHYAHKHKKALFALHFELVYDLFQWNDYHFGAVLDYAWKKSDPHAMIGVHAAFCF